MTRRMYIQQLLNSYTRVAVLSRKNGCTVYRLRHKHQARDLILREFETPVAAYEVLCPIVCDALPMVYDVIALEDGQIVLEEYINGVTVAQVMESGRYRYRGAKAVLTSLCRALTVLHERGLVHRDIKPENVMVDRNGRVVLIDFNASRTVSDASKDTVVMGTVGYASPEQLGVAHSDARTDIYAVGILLNVMMTGKHPSETLARGKAGKIVRKCTGVNPDERYATAEKLAAAL